MKAICQLNGIRHFLADIQQNVVMGKWVVVVEGGGCLETSCLHALPCSVSCASHPENSTRQCKLHFSFWSITFLYLSPYISIKVVVLYCKWTPALRDSSSETWYLNEKHGSVLFPTIKPTKLPVSHIWRVARTTGKTHMSALLFCWTLLLQQKNTDTKWMNEKKPVKDGATADRHTLYLVNLKCVHLAVCCWVCHAGTCQLSSCLNLNSERKRRGREAEGMGWKWKA